MKHYKTVLTIASSDSCGSAGIQADLKTFSSLCCHGMSVVAALTAQNTKGVQAVNSVPARFVGEQLDSILSDTKVDVIKTGLLMSADIINTVAEKIANIKTRSLVVDPVMLSRDKDILLDKRAEKALVGKIFPLAAVVTPNIDEAEYLLNLLITDLDSMKEAARKFCDLGADATLIKGGHLVKMKKSIDCLYIMKNKKFHFFESKRISTKNTHGAGCTFSSAIAAFMAQGDNLVTAISHAKEYVTHAIEAGKDYKLGFGPGPTCHFWNSVK